MITIISFSHLKQVKRFSFGIRVNNQSFEKG